MFAHLGKAGVPPSELLALRQRITVPTKAAAGADFRLGAVAGLCDETFPLPAGHGSAGKGVVASQLDRVGPRHGRSHLPASLE